MSKSVIFPSSCIISLMLFLALNIVLTPTAFAKAEIIKTFTKTECTSAKSVVDIAYDNKGVLWLTGNSDTTITTTAGSSIDHYSFLSSYNGISWKEKEKKDFCDTVSQFIKAYGFEKTASGSLCLLTRKFCTAFCSGDNLVFSYMYKQEDSVWRLNRLSGCYEANNEAVMLDQSILMSWYTNRDTVLISKNGSFVKKAKIGTDDSYGSELHVKVDEAGGAWVFKTSPYYPNKLFFWDGDSSSLFLKWPSDFNHSQGFYSLVGGGLAILSTSNLNSMMPPYSPDTVMFVKNKIIDQRLLLTRNISSPFTLGSIDSLRRLWYFDSTKVWVKSMGNSDTTKASFFGLGNIRDVAVSRNASQTAILCDSGVAIFKIIVNTTPIRPLISSPANLAGKTNLKVQRFSLNGRAITDSKMFRNQIVIERGVDSKINKRLFMRN